MEIRTRSYTQYERYQRQVHKYITQPTEATTLRLKFLRGQDAAIKAQSALNVLPEWSDAPTDTTLEVTMKKLTKYLLSADPHCHPLQPREHCYTVETLCCYDGPDPTNLPSLSKLFILAHNAKIDMLHALNTTYYPESFYKKHHEQYLSMYRDKLTEPADISSSYAVFMQGLLDKLNERPSVPAEDLFEPETTEAHVIQEFLTIIDRSRVLTPIETMEQYKLVAHTRLQTDPGAYLAGMSEEAALELRKMSITRAIRAHIQTHNLCCVYWAALIHCWDILTDPVKLRIRNQRMKEATSILNNIINQYTSETTADEYQAIILAKLAKFNLDEDADMKKQQRDAYMREYHQRPEVKEKQRAYAKERYSKPEIKERYKEYNRNKEKKQRLTTRVLKTSPELQLNRFGQWDD
jgi:hypothetical protein